MTRRIHAVLASAAAAILLAGCTPQTDAPAESTTPAPAPTATPTPTARPARFVLPRTCAEILPASRLDTLVAQNLTLLGGPGGKFGDNYTADPTPERQAGGITCIWGDDASNASSLTVSVAPLSPSNRAVVVSSLDTQGLNQQVDGGLTLYGQFGDETTEPAILNVLRSDSWISVISTHGGDAAYDNALAVANEVALAVYLAG